MIKCQGKHGAYLGRAAERPRAVLDDLGEPKVRHLGVTGRKRAARRAAVIVSRRRARPPPPPAHPTAARTPTHPEARSAGASSESSGVIFEDAAWSDARLDGGQRVTRDARARARPRTQRGARRSDRRAPKGGRVASGSSSRPMPIRRTNHCLRSIRHRSRVARRSSLSVLAAGAAPRPRADDDRLHDGQRPARCHQRDRDCAATSLPLPLSLDCRWSTTVTVRGGGDGSWRCQGGGNLLAAASIGFRYVSYISSLSREPRVARV